MELYQNAPEHSVHNTFSMANAENRYDATGTLKSMTPNARTGQYDIKLDKDFKMIAMTRD